jgi:predicted RNase H-like nuclease (RuvC/YqgF family)
MPDQEGIKRLEALVAVDRKAAQTQSDLDKLRLELRETKAELKKLKALGPERMKRNLAESKKKPVIKNSEIKTRNTEIPTVRKQLREATKELDLSHNELDHFYTSPCERWRLFFTGFQFPEENPNPDSARIRCLDRKTGTSVIATGL